jgi:hypothetical protein
MFLMGVAVRAWLRGAGGELAVEPLEDDDDDDSDSDKQLELSSATFFIDALTLYVSLGSWNGHHPHRQPSR